MYKYTFKEKLFFNLYKTRATAGVRGEFLYIYVNVLFYYHCDGISSQ